MSNNLTTLRDMLFETARALSDKAAPMDIDRARAINDTAQVIINSAKVEIDLLRLTGGKGSGFIPNAIAGDTPRQVDDGKEVVEQRPGVRVTRHTLRGTR